MSVIIQFFLAFFIAGQTHNSVESLGQPDLYPIKDSAKVELKDDKGIVFFQGTWKEALAEAKKQKKHLFVDFYAQWCGPCKMMARQTFTKKKVGEEFNMHYINVKIDIDKNEGPMLKKRYAILNLPTLLIIDHKGKVVGKTVGFQDVSRLVEFGEKHRRIE